MLLGLAVSGYPSQRPTSFSGSESVNGVSEVLSRCNAFDQPRIIFIVIRFNFIQRIQNETLNLLCCLSFEKDYRLSQNKILNLLILIFV